MAKKKEYELLSYKKIALIYGLCFPVSLVSFIIGTLGIFILLDTDKTSSLSVSLFGLLYARLIRANPFFSAAFFNGGLIGLFYSAGKWYDHTVAKAMHQKIKNKKAVKPQKMKGVDAEEDRKSK